MSADQNASHPRKIAIIACSIGWGSGLESAERGPALLLNEGLAQSVQAERVIEITAIPRMSEATLEGDAIERAIMEHAKRVSRAVVDVIEEGYFPVIIGGDHTSALGFHTGLAMAHGETGIVWVDTHPDLNTPETSPSGNIHGMVLGGLLGRGSEPMRGATSECQTREEHVAMVGVRDIDEGEQLWLDEGKIKCMKMSDIHERGLDICMNGAIDIANRAPAGFGLTIDIDVLDPSEAPFVATPVDDGIFMKDLAEAMGKMPHTDRLLGLEVVEFTPRNAGDAKEAHRILATLINAVTGVPVV
jgi:arginase